MKGKKIKKYIHNVEFFFRSLFFFHFFQNPNGNPICFETLWSQSDVDKSNVVLKDICRRTIAHYLHAPGIIVTRISCKEFTNSSESLSIYYQSIYYQSIYYQSIYYQSSDREMERSMQIHHDTNNLESTHYIPASIFF
jgi:hypothetical protein